MPFEQSDWTPAANIGGGTEHVWSDDEGLHITQTAEGEPITGGNLLANSQGIIVKNGGLRTFVAGNDGVSVVSPGNGAISINGKGITFDFSNKPLNKTTISVDDNNKTRFWSESLDIRADKGIDIVASRGIVENGSMVTPHVSVKAAPGKSDAILSLLVSDDIFTINNPNAHRVDVSAKRGVSIDGENVASFPCEVVNSGIWRGLKWSNGYAFIWGRAGVDASASKPWGSMYYGDVGVQFYPFAWKSQPWEITSLLRSKNFLLLDNEENTTTQTASYYTVCPVQKTSTSRCWITYMVAGWWR